MYSDGLKLKLKHISKDPMNSLNTKCMEKEVLQFKFEMMIKKYVLMASAQGWIGAGAMPDKNSESFKLGYK